MRYLRYGVIIAMVLALGSFVFPHSASAQGGIMVWPTWVELTVNRGEQAGKTINVVNQGSEPIRVVAYATDFAIDKEGNFIFSEPGLESYSAARWLSLGKADFEILPGETEEIQVAVYAPAEVEPGGHYAALFFEAVPLSNEGAVSISMRIPSLFYLTVPGATEAEVVANAEISSVLLPSFAGKGSVEAGVVVHNWGNVHLSVAGKAYFDASWGGHSELDLGQMVILPDAEATLKAKWQEAPFMGRVKANVVIGYLGQNGELVNKSQSGEFWVVPWSLIGIIVGVVGLGVPVIVLLGKKYRLRVERK